MDRYTSDTLKDNFEHCVNAWSKELMIKEFWNIYERLAVFERIGTSTEFARLKAELSAAKSDIAALLRDCECEHRHEYCKGASLEECSGHFPGDCSGAEWRGLDEESQNENTTE